MQNARDYLTSLYLSYTNDYLTVALFAEHHGMTETEMSSLLDIARNVATSNHPDA